MLLLSIKPRYVEKILGGEKRVELRRRKPRSQPNDWMAIYECAPTMALVAVARIRKVRVNSPQHLWRQIGRNAGISKTEYDAYFSGSDKAVGIEIETPIPLPLSISLTTLRAEWSGFTPPQGFIYLSDRQQDLIATRIGKTKSRLNDDPLVE